MVFRFQSYLPGTNYTSMSMIGHETSPKFVAVSPSGSSAFTCGTDVYFIIWDIGSGALKLKQNLVTTVNLKQLSCTFVRYLDEDTALVSQNDAIVYLYNTTVR